MNPVEKIRNTARTSQSRPSSASSTSRENKQRTKSKPESQEYVKKTAESFDRLSQGGGLGPSNGCSPIKVQISAMLSATDKGKGKSKAKVLMETPADGSVDAAEQYLGTEVDDIQRALEEAAESSEACCEEFRKRKSQKDITVAQIAENLNSMADPRSMTDKQWEASNIAYKKLQEVLAIVNNEIERLKRELKEANTTIESLETRLDEVKKQLRVEKMKGHSLQKLVDELTEDCKSLRAQLAECQKELDQVRSSTPLGSESPLQTSTSDSLSQESQGGESRRRQRFQLQADHDEHANSAGGQLGTTESSQSVTSLVKTSSGSTRNHSRKKRKEKRVEKSSYLTIWGGKVKATRTIR